MIALRLWYTSSIFVDIVIRVQKQTAIENIMRTFARHEPEREIRILPDQVKTVSRPERETIPSPRDLENVLQTRSTNQTN